MTYGLRLPAVFASLLIAGAPASAQYLEETALPWAQGRGFDVTYDAPVAVPGGQRWRNVAISHEDGDGRLELDWVEEIAVADGYRITISPKGQIAPVREAEWPTAELALDGVVWAVTLGDDAQRHSVVAEALGLEAGDGEAVQLRGVLEALDLGLNIGQGAEIVIEAAGTLGGVGLTVADPGPGAGNVETQLTDLSVRYEFAVPRDFMEAGEALEAEGAKPTPELIEMLKLRSAFTAALASAKVTGNMPNVDDGPGEFEMSATDITSAFQGQADGGMDFGGEVRMGAMGLAVAAPKVEGRLALDAIALEMALAAQDGWLLDLLEAMEADEEPGPMLLSGMDMRYEITSDGMAGDFRIDDGEISGAGQFTSGKGMERIAFNQGLLTFETESEGFDVSGQLPMVSPDELALSMGETRYTIKMPFLPDPSGAAARAVFQLIMRDYAASEAVWALADPQGVIPREPATIALDIEALLTILEPLLGDVEPEEVIALDEVRLNELTLRFGGAEVLGKGAATVDLSGARPVGDGQFELTLNGLIALSGAVAKLGLVPPEALLGLRGALGAFATPTGADAYTSQIVLSPDGTISANGLPLPLD